MMALSTREVWAGNGLISLGHKSVSTNKFKRKKVIKTTSSWKTYKIDQLTGDKLFPVQVGKKFGYRVHVRGDSTSSLSGSGHGEMSTEYDCKITDVMDAMQFHSSLSGKSFLMSCKTIHRYKSTAKPYRDTSKMVFFEELGYWLWVDPKTPKRRLMDPKQYTTLESLILAHPHTAQGR